MYSIKGLWLLCCLLGSLTTQVWAAPQSSVVSKIKAGYIYKFVKYVQWPDEVNRKTFTIGFYGDDEDYYLALLRLQGVEFKGGKVEVKRLSWPVKNQPLDMLIIDRQQSTELESITMGFKTLPTLVISDGAVDKRNIMLNFFTTTNQTLSFELNRYNILNAGLKISADILVLGGTELDIASVLKEMNANLSKTQQALQEQADKLALLEGEIVNREKQLKQQQTKINEQISLLQHQSEELHANKTRFGLLQQDHDQLSDELAESHVQLSQNTQNLDSLTTEIRGKEELIVDLAVQIEQRKQDLQQLQDKQQQQQQQIAAKELEISANLVAMEQQSSVIRTQSNVLMWVGLGFIFVLLLVIIIWQINRAKHHANVALKAHNEELAELNHQLETTQAQLVESEKMAALGELVAGVAHEINTPLGVGITVASHLSEQIESFNQRVIDGKVTRVALNDLLVNAKESSDMLSRNLERAGELVGTFKQVAVDQSGEAKRRFELRAYLEELVQSLSSQLKQGGHQIVIEANQAIKLNSYPGVFAQVMTNLIINSLNHGFKDKAGGLINISLSLDQEQLVIDHRDDGIGLDSGQKDKVFEPFYTTARHSGGTGLGMSISYNLVVSKLGGSIDCLDASSGAHFRLVLPVA